MTSITVNQHEPRVTLRGIMVFALASLFLFYEMALQVSPSGMTAQLMRDLHISAAGLGVLSGTYFYSYAVMQIPAGLLFDRFGSRTLITASLIICVLGAVFFCITGNVYIAAFGRFLMGAGSAFAFIGVLVVAMHWFPARYFAFLVGMAQMLAAVGAMSGEAPFAAMANTMGWRSAFHWIALAGVVLAFLVWAVVRSHPSEATSTTPKESNGQSVWKSLGYVLRSSQTWWIAIYAFSGWAPVTAFAELWGVPYLEAQYGISNTLAATACAMIWVGLAVASPLLGWFSDKLGRRLILLNFCAALGVAATIVMLYASIPFWMMWVLLFLFGIAASGQILSFAVVRDNNRESVRATAIGFNNMAVVIGGALFQPLVGWLLQLHWSGSSHLGVPVYAADNFRLALSVIPLCFFIGLIMSRFLIRETYCQSKYSS